MNKLTEQIIALSGVFTSANLVHNLATKEQNAPNSTSCLIKSLTVINPIQTLDVFHGDYLDLTLGLQDLRRSMLRQHSDNLRCIVQYSLIMIRLEALLAKRKDLLHIISAKLPYIENLADNFGYLSNNVMEACSDLYQQTISTLPERIRIVGEKDILQQPNNANTIRTLLLTGIRCARLWRQLGASRWHLLFKRKQILQELNSLLA